MPTCTRSICKNGCMIPQDCPEDRESSALIPAEPASQPRSLAVATGSLPASSAEVWLASPDQCATASEASLRRALLTVDGAGRAVKTAALDELLRRHAGCVNVRQPEENTK